MTFVTSIEEDFYYNISSWVIPQLRHCQSDPVTKPQNEFEISQLPLMRHLVVGGVCCVSRKMAEMRARYSHQIKRHS